jgi:hypothetical protein
MTQEMSAKDRKMKEAMEKTIKSPERTFFGRYRQLFALLPSDPRCTGCHAPIPYYATNAKSLLRE